MVLPHSVLRTGHHLKFRSGYYESKRPPRSRAAIRAFSFDFSIKQPWDLDNLEPNNFFPSASCVVFAGLNGYWGGRESNKKAAKPLAPGKVEIWTGTTDTPYVPLRQRPGQVHVIGSTGTSHAIRTVAPLIHNDGTFRSPYEPFANQGPTITDRRLFFVAARSNEGLFALPDTFITNPRTGSLDKKTYSVADLEDLLVSGDNLFNVYLGESIAPYTTLAPLTAVLPVSKKAMEMPFDHSRCEELSTGYIRHDACEVDPERLDERMRSRWEIMERLWEANRGKTDTKSLTQNLNWLNKLNSQLEYLCEPGDRPVRVAYTQSGRPTASLIADDRAIVDRKLYQVTCRSQYEAYYLLAIINSQSIEREVGDLMPRGLFGARDLEKHLWKLPIPEYDAGRKLHTDLARLGREAEKECRERLDSLVALNGEDWLTVERARSNIRNGWQQTSATAQAIERSVDQLFSSHMDQDPTQR